MTDRSATGPSWLQPSPEQQGLRRYVDTLRERRGIIALCLVVCTGIALLLLLRSDPVYEARADLLITPVPTSSETLVSLGLLRETNDPAREVDTAAQLITTTAVAEQVAEELGLDRDARDLLADVEATPVAQSNIVAVSARSGSAVEARDIANAFARTAVEQRTNELHERIEDVLPRLRSQLRSLPVDELTAQELATQIAQLETLLASPDPTMSLETPAIIPDSQVSPKPALTILGGVLAGLVLGVALAFALRLLDPRLRREEQLGQLFRLPVLARIPSEPTRSLQPLRREQLTAGGVEAYRTLRARLTSGASTDQPRSIMITGPSASGGKTTTAINLATSLAAAANSVILIEADVRRPSIGKALGVEAEQGLVSVLFEETPLAEALTTSGQELGHMKLLLADVTGPVAAELVSLPVMRRLVDDAKQLADYVIVDSPPMTEVVDALPLAVDTDEVVIVVRLGRSLLRQTKELGELLAGVGVTPAGVVIVGVARSGEQYYYTRDGSGQEPRDRTAKRDSEPDRATGTRGATPPSTRSASRSA